MDETMELKESLKAAIAFFEPPTSSSNEQSTRDSLLGVLCRAHATIERLQAENATFHERIVTAWHRSPTEGWRLVPVEPTPDMQVAGGRQADNFLSEDGPYPRTKAMWRAMLAAAPSPAPDATMTETE